MTGEEEYDEVQRLCAAALEAVRPLLHTVGYESGWEWIHQYGELKLAVEHIIDCLDDDVPLTESQFRAVQAAAAAVGGLDPQRTAYLETTLRGPGS